MTCPACGCEASTQMVTLHQNVGALVRRMPRRFEAKLCRACIVERFWGVTLVNGTLGLLGLISLFVGFYNHARNLRVLWRARRLGRPARPPRVRPAVLVAMQDGLVDFVDCLFARAGPR
jgi:hypothetical protein